MNFKKRISTLSLALVLIIAHNSFCAELPTDIVQKELIHQIISSGTAVDSIQLLRKLSLTNKELNAYIQEKPESLVTLLSHKTENNPARAAFLLHKYKLLNDKQYKAMQTQYPSTEDVDYESELFSAISNKNNKKIMTLLEKPSIDINAHFVSVNIGYTPFSYALAVSPLGGILKPETLTQFLKVPGFDINVKNNGDEELSPGSTALMVALKTANIEKVNLVLSDPKVDVNLTNNQGETALDIANNLKTASKQNDIIRILKARGAKTGAELKNR